jgi:hypothetical protein
MRAQYDFSKMKEQRNPYRGRLKQPITIRLDKATVAYFKGLADESGCPTRTSSICICEIARSTEGA